MALVYSTEKGRVCSDCGAPQKECRCKANGNKTILGDGVVRITRETKGRKGKGVTLIKGLALCNDELKILAKQLKQRCSTGGTIKEGVVEIQGDHRDLLLSELNKLGYAAKISGG